MPFRVPIKHAAKRKEKMVQIKQNYTPNNQKKLDVWSKLPTDLLG